MFVDDDDDEEEGGRKVINRLELAHFDVGLMECKEGTCGLRQTKISFFLI